jgi:hypothetical protein
MLANSLGFTDVEAKSNSVEVIQLSSGVERIWSVATAIYTDVLNSAGSIGKVALVENGATGPVCLGLQSRFSNRDQ